MSSRGQAIVSDAPRAHVARVLSMLGLARARWDAGVHASPDDARGGGDDEGEDGRSNADLDIVARCVSVVARSLTDPALASLGQSGERLRAGSDRRR